MTGPEHYREAERLEAQIASAGQSWANEHGDLMLARAQIHATLALAAAGLAAGGYEDNEMRNARMDAETGGPF